MHNKTIVYLPSEVKKKQKIKINVFPYSLFALLCVYCMAFCRVKITNGHFSVFEKADSFCLVIGSIIVAKFGFPFIDGLFCNLKCIGS